MAVDLSIGLSEVVECVFDRKGAPPSVLGMPIDKTVPDYCELLVFLHDDEPADLEKASMFSSIYAGASPCVRIKATHLEKINQSSRRNVLLPKTDVHIELAKCRSEFDITLVDRIHALLNHQTLSSHNGNSRVHKSVDPLLQSRQAMFTQAIMDNVHTASETKVGLKVSSPFISFTIRFPIPDLRSGQNVDRLPWWRRSLRKEVAVLELSDAELQTTFCAADSESKFEFTCRNAHGLFQESADKPLTSFIRITTEDASMQEEAQGFNWPRLVIKKFPEIHSVLEEDADSEDSTPQDSLNGACQFTKPEPSPFSSSKAMFDNEELVMPGEKEEIQIFQEKAVNNTLLLIDFSLPNVNIQLPSKLFLEVLYNRLNNDLLMWEPLAPIPTDTHEAYSMPSSAWDLNLAAHLMQHHDGPDSFSMCKSGVQYDSSSDSEETSDPYFSTTDPRSRQKRKQKQEKRQSKVCVNLTVTKGKLRTSNPLVEDGVVNKEKHGEFVLEVADGSLFAVVGYGGDKSLAYLCIEANRAALFHADCVDIPTTWPTLGRATSGIASHLHPTIYLSEAGVHTKLSGLVGLGPDAMDMVSIAIKIKNDRPRSVKEFQVALGIRGGTLQHRVMQSGHGWFPQLLELLDLKDYPILGYTMPRTLTELHCHLWSCAIDYRPLYLPLRALLAVESFSISSNIVLNSNVSMLRFIIEDAALYLSKRLKTHAVDLKKNYVCVMDVGLLELSLRSSDGKDPKHPKTDLRLSNNIVHMRTCADSCRALADLIQYFAGDGDLGEEGDWRSDSTVKSRRGSASSHSTGYSGSPQLSQSNMEKMHDLMADALQESQSSRVDESSSEDETGGGRGPTEVFFFPASMAAAMDDMEPPQSALRLPAPASSPAAREITVTTSSGGSLASSTVSHHSEHDSGDEEFCIIDDPGLGIAPRDGEPKIRVLQKEPIVIKDNHFSLPLGKTDQLKAPEHFPPAVQRYTLREMSLIWYMYGGSDFSSHKNTADASPTSLGAKKSSKGAAKMGRLGWMARGGPNRDIETLMELQLSKVRMQYELYPENTEQALRQIFIVNEVEVRDRLALSRINKFLYQYTSESLPRQTHANMFVIKAVHMRPDPVLPAQECALKVSILPLRLNIDQDSLFFLRTFFTSITGEDASSDKELSGEPEPEPVMRVALPPDAAAEGEEPDPDLLIMFDEITEHDEPPAADAEEPPVRAQPTYFRSFVFSPDVPIRLDYHGKRVDMEQGTLAGLLVGLAQLNCSELRLKRLHHRHGLLGVHRLILYALNEWLQDLKKNQLPSILGGVGPMYSLVQLVQGIRDLFWLPVEQYRKDGRIVRGLQRGAHSFTTSTAMAALELTNRLVQTVQYVAEVAFDMVSPGPSVRHKKHHQRLLRAAQPTDIREGVANAYVVVKEGITDTAKTIVHVASAEHEHKGIAGAVGGVLRQVPPTLIQPVIMATEATSNVLGGMRNQLRPDRKREDEDKWKPEES